MYTPGISYFILSPIRSNVKSTNICPNLLIGRYYKIKLNALTPFVNFQRDFNQSRSANSEVIIQIKENPFQFRTPFLKR